MSGHSKWSKLKHTKGAIDNARGKIFSKLIKEVTVASKLGGPDLSANPRLRTAVDKAKSNSMHKDTIDRAIARGAGDLGGEDFEKLMYEGYGPGGIAVIVCCLTDNRVRTVADVRNAFTKTGGNMGTAGSVAYMFQQKGVFSLPKGELDEDTVMTAALEGGADDMQAQDDEWSVTCVFEGYDACKKALEGLGADVQGEIVYLPDNQIAIDVEDARKLLKLIDRLEDLDDVQETFTNADLSDDVMSHLE